ncbi:MAG: hypothetical protein QM493_01640 [Sulfurovum sp.]
MSIFKKFAPLIILAIFLVGGYFIKQGMDNAINISKPKQVVKMNESSP